MEGGEAGEEIGSWLRASVSIVGLAVKVNVIVLTCTRGRCSTTSVDEAFDGNLIRV